MLSLDIIAAAAAPTAWYAPPPAGFMATCEDINERMRRILLEWLTEVHSKLSKEEVELEGGAAPPLNWTSHGLLHLCFNLIDRYLVNAEVHDIPALVCINKADLLDHSALQPVAAMYGQLGYNVVVTSAVTGQGVDRLRELLCDRETAVSGQSGVGKSSLLNAVDETLTLETSDVSDGNQKGRHTTRRTHLLALKHGGWVADTPGIRQFELWNVGLEEVDGFFIEFRSFIPYCRFPDCSHLHENHCAVKDAVVEGLIARRRYESYVRIREEEAPHWKAPPPEMF